MGQLTTSFNSLMDRYGFETNLRRIVSSDVDIQLLVRVARRYAEEDPLVHDVSQSTTTFHVRIRELQDAGFPLPIKKGDRIMDDEVWYTIFVVEPLRDGQTVIGYRVRASGD